MPFRYVTLMILFLISNILILLLQTESRVVNVIVFYLPLIALFYLAEKTKLNDIKIKWYIGCIIIAAIVVIDLAILEI